MKGFITKYKTQIISIITAISALALALTSLGGEVTRVCEIVIAIDAVLIAILKTGFDNKFVDNSVALLKLLQDQYNITPSVQPATDKVAGASNAETTAKSIIMKDGTVIQLNEPVVDEAPINPIEKLSDDQLKELVESYLHPTTSVKEADNSEEKDN